MSSLASGREGVYLVQWYLDITLFAFCLMTTISIAYRYHMLKGRMQAPKGNHGAALTMGEFNNFVSLIINIFFRTFNQEHMDSSLPLQGIVHCGLGFLLHCGIEMVDQNPLVVPF